MAPFIPNLSAMSEPLRNLLKKDIDFQWSPSHKTAFENIKQSICREVSLTYFDPDKETVVQVDASLRGLSAGRQGNCIRIQGTRRHWETLRKYWAWDACRCCCLWEISLLHIWQEIHSGVGSQAPRNESFKEFNSWTPKTSANAAQDTRVRHDNQVQTWNWNAPCWPNVKTQSLARWRIVEPTRRVPGAILWYKTGHPQTRHLIRSETIYFGSPEKQKQVPVHLKKYWAYRDELSIENGLILKRERVVIPKSQRSDIVERIHQAHQGVEKCQLRVRSCAFWPEINKDIEARVKKCEVCQESQNTQAKETLEPQEVPTRPWQVVGTDLFSWDRDEHLLMCDYYSKFPIIKKIPRGQSTGSTVVNLTKCVFSEQGVPVVIISDNGPHYDCKSYKEFSKEWGFQHITWSPRYPQSNGFIERQVQAVKHTLDKAKKSGLDMLLLCLRSTPVDSQLPSPAELL